MKKLLPLLALLVICIPAFGAALPNYPIVTTLNPGDRIPLSRSNSPSAFPTRNIEYTNLVIQLRTDLPISGSGITDGDKGDVVVAGAGTDWQLDVGVVGASELDEAGVEAGLEAVLDLQELQGAVTDGQVPDNITTDDDTNAFDDADANWTATAVGPALEELDDENGGDDLPNKATGKVNWEQLVGVPAGFADGTDDGAGASGDPVLFNTTAVGDASGVDFKDVTATASVAGITWGLNTTPTPDHASNTVSVATGSIAGVVTANAQTIGGLKSFTGGIASTNAPAYFSGPIWHDWETVSGTEVDASTGNSFTKTLGANLTFTVVNAVDGYTFRFRLVQNGTGGFTATAPSHIPLNGTSQSAATVLNINTNANAITTFYFTRIGGAWEMRGPDGMSNIALDKFGSGTMTSAEFFAQTTDEVGGSGLLAGNLGATHTNMVTQGVQHLGNTTNTVVGANNVYVNDASSVATGVAVTGSGNIMRTRVGVVRSFSIPMGAWFTNGIASPATPASYTNTADAFQFVDGSTNTVRVRFPLPVSWDAGTVKFKFVSGTTSTNETSNTNVVWSIKGATIGGGTTGEDEVSLTFGTAVTVTNHVNKSQYVSSEFVTPSITVGNTPVAASDIVWEVTRLTSDATDNNTNTISLLGTAQIFYTESSTEPSMPATTN